MKAAKCASLVVTIATFYKTGAAVRNHQPKSYRLSQETVHFCALPITGNQFFEPHWESVHETAWICLFGCRLDRALCG